MIEICGKLDKFELNFPHISIIYILFICFIFYSTELNVKILRDDSSCPGACQVIQWMKACFDALEKKYVSH